MPILNSKEEQGSKTARNQVTEHIHSDETMNNNMAAQPSSSPTPHHNELNTDKSNEQGGDTRAVVVDQENLTDIDPEVQKEEFCRRIFELPSTEPILEDYSCAYYNRMLFHGRMYITENHILFYSNILGKRTVTINVEDIADVVKRNSAYVVPNAIEIYIRGTSYFFSSFAYRDLAFKTIQSLWMQQMKSMYDKYKTGGGNKSPRIASPPSSATSSPKPIKAQDLIQFPTENSSELAVRFFPSRSLSNSATQSPTEEYQEMNPQSLPTSPRRRSNSIHSRSRSDATQSKRTSAHLDSSLPHDISVHETFSLDTLRNLLLRDKNSSKPQMTAEKIKPDKTESQPNNNNKLVPTEQQQEQDSQKKDTRTNTTTMESSPVDKNEHHHSSDTHESIANDQSQHTSASSSSSDKKVHRTAIDIPRGSVSNNTNVATTFVVGSSSPPLSSKVTAALTFKDRPRSMGSLTNSWKTSPLRAQITHTLRDFSPIGKSHNSTLSESASENHSNGGGENHDEPSVSSSSQVDGINDIPDIIVSTPDEPMYYELDLRKEEDQLPLVSVEDIDIFPVNGVKMVKLFEDSKFMVSAHELFDLTLSNKSDTMLEYHAAVGDTEVVIDDWVDFRPGVPSVRCIKMTVDRESAYAQLLPQKVSTVLLETQRFMMTKNKMNTQTYMVLHSTIAPQTLLKDDRFQIEVKLFVTDTRVSTSARKECVLQVYAGASYKNSFRRSTMEQIALKATMTRSRTWVDILTKRVEQYLAEKEEQRLQQIQTTTEAILTSAIVKYEKRKLLDLTPFLLPPAPQLEDSPPPSPNATISNMNGFELSPIEPVRTITAASRRIKKKQQQRMPTPRTKHTEIELQSVGTPPTPVGNIVEEEEQHPATPETPLGGALKSVIDLQDFSLFSEDSTELNLEFKPRNDNTEERPKPKIIVEVPKEEIKTVATAIPFTPKEDDEGTVLRSIVSSLRFILIGLLQIGKFMGQFIGEHKSLMVTILLVVYVSYMSILNGAIVNRLSGMQSDLSDQRKQTVEEYQLVRQLVSNTDKFSEQYWKDTVLDHLVRNRKLNTPPNALAAMLNVLRQKMNE